MPSPSGWGRAEPAPRCRPDREGYHWTSARAGVAHLVERDLAKVEVAGSKPVSRSTFPIRNRPPDAWFDPYRDPYRPPRAQP